MRKRFLRTTVSFIGFALTARCLQCSALTGPDVLGDDGSLPKLGRRLGADGSPHSTSATELRPSAQPLAGAECYEIMAPKIQLVAMMFLIRERVHPESVWRDWLLPISKVVHPDIECDAQVKHCYKETLMIQPARSVYDEQGFFTFYVHAKPGAPAFPRGSIFYEREVKDPIETEWGSHTLSQATRRLLQAALENPLNQRFVLMCGSSIPLRPVVFTYSQLIAEKRSRFDGYGFTRDDDQERKTLVDPYRYPVSMHEEWPELANHVSGHGQFWVLNRKHAEIVSADEFVDRLFARHCFTSISQRTDVESRQWCVSDEQYVGTVLNKALGHALRGEILHDDPVMLNFVTGTGYKPEAVTIELILWGRNAYNISSEALGDEVISPTGELCRAAERPQWHLMILDHWVDKCTEYHIDTREQPSVLSTLAAYPHCPLFLRKFKEQAADLVAPLLHEMRIISAFTKDHHD